MSRKKSKGTRTAAPLIDPSAHATFKRQMREEHAAAKLRIENGIIKITAAFEEYDALHVLAQLSLENCFIDADTYNEPTDDHVEAYVEYAQSVALATDKWGTTKPVAEWVDDCRRSS